MTHVIYALRDPDTGDIRYVGMTGNLERRIIAHMQPVTNVQRWIEELRKSGKTIKVDVLQECSFEAALLAERAWIDKMLSRGCDLLNISGVPVTSPSYPERQRRRQGQDWSDKKNITVPVAMHANIKAISDRDDLTMYEVVAKAIEAYEWRRQLLVVLPPSNHHTEPTP